MFDDAEQKKEGVLVIVDRYYYHQLNKQEQAIYKVFYDGVMAHQDIIPIPVRGELHQESFERIFSAMTRDNPLIYFLNQSACSIASDIFGHMAICPQYFFTKEKVKEYNRKIEKIVNELAGTLRLLECSDYEKELRIHDWICQNVEYDYEGTDKSKLSRVIASHNILGVFAYHKAQCEGIAKAVKVLLNAVDIKCIVVTGNSMKNGKSLPHAWNIVNINGDPYQLDVTWDIGGSGQNKKHKRYDYFNLTDELINRDHKMADKLPECRKKTENYYVKNRCSFQNRHQLVTYIDKILEKNANVLEFRVEGSLNHSSIEEEVSDYIIQKLQKKEKNKGRIKISSNKKMGIYWMEIY